MNQLINHESHVGIAIRSKKHGSMEALIDSSDAQMIRSLNVRWHAKWHPSACTFYVSAKLDGRTIYLHRIIARCPKGLVVDHRNFNGLDCRRTNIRIVTYSVNSLEQSAYPGRGVSIDSRTGRFRVRVNHLHHGLFDSREEAQAKALSIYRQLISNDQCFTARVPL